MQNFPIRMTTKMTASMALAVGMLVAAGCSSGPGYDASSVAVAEMVPLDITVEELGVVEATRVLSVDTPFSGRLVSIVDTGTLVSEGDVVAVLDTRDIEERLEDQIESLKSTKKEMEGIMEQLQIALRNNMLDVSSANTQLDLARVQLENVNLNLADLEYLHSRQLVSDDSVRDATSSMRRSQIQTLTQDLGLRSQVTGTLSTEKTQEVRIERIGLQGMESIVRINEFNDRIDRSQVRAPADGLFLRHTSWNWQMRRNTERQSGENVGENEPLGRIPDLNSLVIQTQIPESEMLRIETGMEAEVYFESFGNLRIPGEITFIAPMAIERETAPGGRITAAGEQLSGEKVFEIEVDLKETDERLRPGQTARVRLMLERTESLLTIPLEAINTRNGEHFVMILVEEQPVRRTITVGRSNNSRAEILSGLNEGDRVLTSGY
ncbi:MAG: HlyD family efflux transporter periplasmic adaptor subunit [Candidatus Sumerlaeia bacterium]|nr:HlyD family efflux transporter periplasmic adaptor subunit [Candidatus Sumerlaeia bacterium]